MGLTQQEVFVLSAMLESQIDELTVRDRDSLMSLV